MPTRHVPRLLLVLAVPFALLAVAFTVPARLVAASLSIYANTLGTGWNDWSWSPITRSLTNSSPHHGGSGAPTPASPAPSGGPALTVNAAADLHPISPDIYGLNFADPAL